MDYKKRVERAETESRYIKKLFQWMRTLLIIFGITVLSACWGIQGAKNYQMIIGWVSIVFAVVSAVGSGIIALGIHNGKKHVLELIEK